MQTDVLIIGGGAAGLAAAYEIAEKGLTVTLVEQSWSLGGHLREQTARLGHMPEKFAGLSGHELADQLIKQLQPYAIQLLLNHTLIGRYKDGHFGVSDGKRVFSVRAEKVIFATGAAEKPIAFPKWTLPGIMTAGAAQIFMNREMVKPGNEMVMVGSSDFALEVCFQLHEAGVRVKGIIEKNSKLKAKKQKNLEQVSALHIPVYLQSEIGTAAGKHTVEKVFLHTRDKELEIKVDLVCTEGGFIPAIEPFQMADSSVTYVEALGGWVPAYDKHFRTSEQNIYIAGDAAGITCHGALILTGALAGIHVMEDIGPGLDLTQRKKELWRELECIESGFNHCVWDARVQHMAGATIN